MTIKAAPSLALRDLARRPVRHGLLVLCVAAVTGLQLAAFLIDAAGRRGLEIGLERLGADLVAVPRGEDGALTDTYMTGEASLFYMDRALLGRVAAMDFVEKVSSQVFIKSLSGASCCSAWSVFLIGFDPETDFTIRPWLSADPSRRIGPDQILVGPALGFEEGQTVRFYGRPFTVAGVLAPSGMGLDSAVFIPNRSAYLMAAESGVKAEKKLDLPPDRVSAITIKLKPEEEGGLPDWKAAYELEMAIKEISVIQPLDVSKKLSANMSGTLKSLRSAGYAIWPITAIFIGLVFAMSASEKRREIGLLRALGATRWFVFRSILAEASIIAAAGAALGCLVSIGLVAAFSRAISLSLEVPFYWPENSALASAAAVAFFLSLLTGALAALHPAASAANMEPYEAIRRGE